MSKFDTSAQHEYIVRVQEPGAEPGWLPMPGVKMLSTAENRGKLFNKAGYNVEIDQVITKTIRRWVPDKGKPLAEANFDDPDGQPCGCKDYHLADCPLHSTISEPIGKENVQAVTSRCPAGHWEPGLGPCICGGRVHPE